VTAGGGGGGFRGGGGAGGLVHYDQYPVTPGTTYTVTVGTGGVGNYIKGTGEPPRVPATPGNSSSFGPVVAIGGGAGSGDAISNPDADGGSGGGEGVYSLTSMGVGQGRGTPGQGNDGGKAGSPYVCGGGGGGAGGAGGDSEGENPGNGGAGAYYSITGTSVCYAGGGGAGNCGYLSKGGCPGGGDGWGWCLGCSQVSTSIIYSTPVPANTGGGGGADFPFVPDGPLVSRTDSLSNNGGSGIVVLRY
jgi:hypothetical protein